MFCFQCQETIHNHGCTLSGACGKKPEVADLQDELLRQLKRLALEINRPTREQGRFVAEALFMTVTNANFDPARISKRIAAVKAMITNSNSDAPLGVKSESDEDIRSLRELVTYGLKGVAAYADHAAILGFEEDEIYRFLFRALKSCAAERSTGKLLELVMECGHVAVDAMCLLDTANTARFGHPVAGTAVTTAGTRPGILVSGHDLLDLQELLEESSDAGIDIYTHGEMLPANFYPELKKYPHLHGNYGGSWHLQAIDFTSFNGPILMTTNCITPVQESYANRIFTTGAAGYPGVPHIPDRLPGARKNFSSLIDLARKCKVPTPLASRGLPGGCARNMLFSLTDKVVEAVKNGHIRRFVVMAGCDGRHKSREYYTEFAELLPPDAVILTAGCAKYRYNHLKLGEIDGIPRLIDAGQCNDSYSLAAFALKLKERFALDDVNQLPISFNIAWYEQKAVAVLLALLALGFKNIRLGPTLPAFLSPGTAKILVEKFNISQSGNAPEDLELVMAGK